MFDSGGNRGVDVLILERMDVCRLWLCGDLRWSEDLAETQRNPKRPKLWMGRTARRRAVREATRPLSGMIWATLARLAVTF